MRPPRRTDARTPHALHPQVEGLEGRCVCSVGLLDTDPDLFLAVRSVASFESIVVTEREPAPSPIPDVVSLAPATPTEPIAIIDWGDGVVTEAKVTTDETGQTVVTAERVLDAATTYDATLVLADTATVVTFQLTTAVPAPALTPPVPSVPVAPPPRPVTPAATPEVADPLPVPPAPKPTDEPQPVIVQVTVGPPPNRTPPQFEAGAVRASLSAPVAPTVSVTATSLAAPIQVSAVQVMRTALPMAAPQAPPTEFVAAPRSFEVMAATRVGARTTAGRVEPRGTQLFDADWHGPALATDDDVLTALAAESVDDAPFFAMTKTEEPERGSRWQSVSVVIAALIGVGARHYFVRDDENDRLDDCTQ